jgi:ribulose-5-phosphate 4-epimerase/fuculose-1-phosphate aldolase
MMADDLGGEIPVGPFALIGDDSIGCGIVETLQVHQSSAVLMRNHGPFAIGPSAKAAVKAAVMCEEVVRTIHIARQLGEPLPIAQSNIDSLLRPLPERLRPDRKQMIMTQEPTCWFFTGSQGLYGYETLGQVEW